MEKIYAFTDEYGAFGWDFSKEGVSTHFIITAIIVKEQDVDSLKDSVELVRKKYFQTGEIKSSKIGKKHKKRLTIIQGVKDMPFTIFSVVIDKRDCEFMPGLRYKKSFYKFMNNILHKELRKAFSNLTIVADEIGGSEYMKSFISYVKRNEEPPNFFGESEFSFSQSHNNVLVQLADFMSGTLSFVYDPIRKANDVDVPDYFELLKHKICGVMLYPKTYDTYVLNTSAIAEDYDKDIAELCYNQAITFSEQNKDNDEDEDIKKQVAVLEYLLFRFRNNDTRGYIPTKELKSFLRYRGFESMSDQVFRSNIIGKLRDKGVIIASSSKGYMIPTKEAHLYDFINHGSSIVIPMLERMQKCRNLVKMATNNELDLFDHEEYKKIKRFFDSKK